ncbi:hydroxyethylthiazole kinase [Clostridiaceae bacterium 35-E11]
MDSAEHCQRIGHALTQVKNTRPLVHHITNYVTANDSANTVLALGGSPVMADAPIEVEYMTARANALVLNLGTCRPETVTAMTLAGKIANQKHIPIVLDPVGIGATPFRYESALKLIEELDIHVIRGNMSEIKLLAGLETKNHGVDSADDDPDGAKIAMTLANKYRTIVAITGKTDVISDGGTICLLDHGHKYLTQITGAGCMTTSLIGCYLGANKDFFLATTAGILTMGLAGEKAAARMTPHDGMGSFKVYLMDAIYHMTPEILKKKGKIQYVFSNE